MYHPGRQIKNLFHKHRSPQQQIENQLEMHGLINLKQFETI